MESEKVTKEMIEEGSRRRAEEEMREASEAAEEVQRRAAMIEAWTELPCDPPEVGHLIIRDAATPIAQAVDNAHAVGRTVMGRRRPKHGEHITNLFGVKTTSAQSSDDLEGYAIPSKIELVIDHLRCGNGYFTIKGMGDLIRQHMERREKYDVPLGESPPVAVVGAKENQTPTISYWVVDLTYVWDIEVYYYDPLEAQAMPNAPIHKADKATGTD